MERKELENVSDFTLGEENVAFAPYFIGKSYLSLLNDKEVGINWPIQGIELLLSDKDKNQKTLKELDIIFEYKGEV